MAEPHDSSVLFSLRELRSMEDERIAEERQAMLRAEQDRERRVREAEEAARAELHEQRLAAEAKARADRESRERREREQRRHAEEMARHAEIQRRLELDRQHLENEMRIKAVEASKKKPTLLLAIVSVLVVGAGTLVLWSYQQHQSQQQKAARYQAQMAELRQKAEQAQMRLDETSQALDAARDKLLHEQTETGKKAAREAVAKAEADKRAAVERQREQERLQRKRRAEWERLHGKIKVDSDCAKDPLCGAGSK